MSPRKVNKWHWRIAGALLGFFAGMSVVLLGLRQDTVMRPPLQLQDFDTLIKNHQQDLQLVQNICVHANDSAGNFVTGEVRNEGGWQSFGLYAPIPLVSPDGHTFLDVRDYLKHYPEVSYLYCWWEEPRFAIFGGMLIGTLVVGWLLPFVLSVLLPIDLKQEEQKIKLFASGRQLVVKKPGGDGEHGSFEVASVNDAQPKEPPPPPAEVKPVPILPGAPLLEPAPAEPTLPKDYRGEFYPVAKPPRDHAFALIELLVVIAIIAVIVSMLLPVLTRARRSAEVLVCANNQRQIFLALQMYLNENHGITFWRGDDINTDGMDWYVYGGREQGNANQKQLGLFNRIIPRPLNRYAGGKISIFRCPRDDAAPWTTSDSAPSEFEWVGNSYNFNANGYPLRPLPRHDGGLDEVSFAGIKDSSNVIVFYEACLYWGYDWHYAHKGNVTFADGHVSFIPLPEQIAEYHWNP